MLRIYLFQIILNNKAHSIWFATILIYFSSYVFGVNQIGMQFVLYETDSLFEPLGILYSKQ